MMTASQANSIFARISYCPARMIIDSGATYSCISHSLYTRLKLPLQQPDENTPELIAANGQRLLITGSVEANICINGFNFGHRFIVLKDLKQQGLIGLDFLQAYRGVISIASNTLFLMNGLVATPLIHKDDCDHTLTLSKDVLIPPHTEAKIPVTINQNYTPQLSITEGHASQINKLFIARCLVQPTSKDTVCQVLNASDRILKLRKGCKIGMISPVDPSDPENKRLLSTNFSNMNSIAMNSPKLGQAENESHESKLNALQNLGIDFAQTALEKHDFEQLIDLIFEYKELFEASPTNLPISTLPPMKIELTTKKPFRQAQYRLSPAMQEEVNKQCDDLLAAKIIRPSTSQYNSPLIVVKKFDSAKQISGYRMVLDMRFLNKITVPEFTVLESLASCRDKVAQMKPKIFTTLDQKSGYHSIELDELSRPLTAFSTNNSRYEYTRCPFGARNSGAHFSRAITDLLKPHQNRHILVYVDDLCLISKDFKSHLEVITEVFQKYKLAKLRLNPSKANFAAKSILFLGMEFSETGCRVNPKRFELIKTWKRPQDIKQLRTWLGMTTYFRSFIKGHSQLTYPLRQLLMKDSKAFIWGEEQENAFNRIKEILISDVILEYPELNAEMILETDSSLSGLGYVLKQFDPISKKEKVIEYAGRSLRKHELNMDIYRLEILALISGIQHFRMYLQSDRQFLVRTDNISVKYIQTLKYGKSQSVRWSIFLDQFNYRLTHLSSDKNSVSDALSRRQYDPTKETIDTSITDGIDMNAYVATIEDVPISSNEFCKNLMDQPKRLKKAEKRHIKSHSHTISFIADQPDESIDDEAHVDDNAGESTIVKTTESILPDINLESQCDDNLFNSIITYLTEDKLPTDKSRAREV